MPKAALLAAAAGLALALPASRLLAEDPPVCDAKGKPATSDPCVTLQDKPETRGFSIGRRPEASAPAQAVRPAPPAPAPAPVRRQTRPLFESDGTVRVPAFELPPSMLSSPQAREAQAARSRMAGGVPATDGDIAVARRGLEAMLAPQVAEMRRVYPVDVLDQTIAGVPTRVVTPKGRKFDPKRILINLHGSGFSLCAEACALLESAPIAALGGFKVVAVNYRMGPEARHPAALEDVEKVYRDLLKRYKPQSIGIYGCASGGALSAQAGAWLPAHGLPQAGALGIFSAGAVRSVSGDSAWIAANIDGSLPAPPKPGETPGDMARGYFTGVQLSDPILSPALHPDIMAKFPPTLIITGTRSADLSPAITTNSALLKAGVRSTLIVGEGMAHCYIYQPNLPEAKDAHAAIVAFFRANLK